jgi:guanyl-specific ribonuclease Sa
MYGGASIAGAPGSGMAVRGVAGAVGQAAAAEAAFPANARATLGHVQATGQAPAGYKGGGTFRNDGRGGGQQLPQSDASGKPITYREWDVNPYQKGVNRGGERLVTGSDGSSYYTSDHYRTFSKVPQ